MEHRPIIHRRTGRRRVSFLVSQAVKVPGWWQTRQAVGCVEEQAVDVASTSEPVSEGLTCWVESVPSCVTDWISLGVNFSTSWARRSSQGNGDLRSIVSGTPSVGGSFFLRFPSAWYLPRLVDCGPACQAQARLRVLLLLLQERVKMASHVRGFLGTLLLIGHSSHPE